MLSRRFLTAALVLLVAYGIMHGAGCRDFVTILTGTVPGDVSEGAAVLLGSGYVLAYLVCWIVAPVLVIAAALYWLLSFALSSRSPRG